MRRRAAAASLAAAALLMAACGSGDDDTAESGAGKTKPKADAPLRVEAAEGPRGTELIVYVIDEAANTPRSAGGRKKVELRCFDKARGVLVEEAHRWPFTDTDHGLTDAHVHQRVPRTKATQVSRCELEGTRGPLSGELMSTGFE